MQLSVIVVTFNEEARLKDCLESLKPFEDITLVDLGSQDHSVEIAKGLGIKVITHDWVPIVEMVLADVVPMLQNDWILRLDPDEVIPSDLIMDLNKFDPSEKIGMIYLPERYYFLNKYLGTTIWGGIRPLPHILHRERAIIEPVVHRAFHCKPGYVKYDLPFRPENAIQHFWIDSYAQFFEKQERYNAKEGQSMYNNGFRFSWSGLLLEPIKHFKHSFINTSGWRGGWHGWFLSFFYAYYEMKAWISLRKFEAEQK